MQALQLLSEKLDLLLKKYSTLEAENARLKKTVFRQVQEMEGLNKKLATLEHDMSAVHIGNGVMEEKDKAALRKQLDTLIGEIDKMLGALND